MIGEHIGAHFFTKGQRKGLKIGGHKEPLFVIETDVKNNIIYVGEGNSHPGLLKKTIFIPFAEAHWIRKDLELRNNEFFEIVSRVRYRQELKPSTLYRTSIGYFLRFKEKISGISEGQFVACYFCKELFFSGIINNYN